MIHKMIHPSALPTYLYPLEVTRELFARTYIHTYIYIAEDVRTGEGETKHEE